MFGPSSAWPPCSCAPSSVTQWLLYRTVLITVLFAVASSSSDWCNHLQSDFTGHVQTIGPLDGRLWAITTEWTVHEMTPCDKGNETLSLCMEIGFPVQVDTKWPELAKSVKENANVTDFNFTVDNSVFMDSSENGHFLIMHGKKFKPSEYFGFNFSANSSKVTDAATEDFFKSLWISSDGKNKTYRLVDSGTGLKQITGSVVDPVWDIIDVPVTPVEHICNVTSDGEFSLNITTDACTTNMIWTVKKAVRYSGQFYFFTKDQVYIFAAIENVTTKVHSVSYDSFIHCKVPTTTSPPTSPPSNVTKSAITTVSEHNLTSVSTTKGSNKTMIIVIVIVAVLAIIGIILAFVFCKKPSKSSQNTTAQPVGKANNKVSPKKAGPSKMPESQVGSTMSSAADSKAGKKPQSQVSAPKGSSVISGQGKHSKSQAK